MKLPNALGLVWRVVDTLLGIAIRADDIAARRRARKRLEGLGEARRKDEAGARSRTPTVVLRRPPP
jgi:hypothetical protein